MTYSLPPFIPGLELSRRFYLQAVVPVWERFFPGLVHSAGRLDSGSEVLGFDTPISRDHGWGPKVWLFLDENDFQGKQEEIGRTLGQELPFEVLGYPTNFDGSAVWIMRRSRVRPIRHGVVVTTCERFFQSKLGFNPANWIARDDWLTTASQQLRTIVCGEVFHDGLDCLHRVRRRLHWYPDDIWRYLLAAQWRRIAQEQAFQARCGDVGDDLGSRVLTDRQVFEIMRLAFLLERAYPPYSKWLGRAFASLGCSEHLSPLLSAAQRAETWRGREEHLGAAFLRLGELQNALALAAPVDVRIGGFFDRPYRVPHAERFAEALERSIGDPGVRALPQGIGAVWQFVDSTDVLSHPERCRAIRSVYRQNSL